jgi:hypothetical protein
VGDRAVGVAGHLKQVRPHRVEPVLAGQSRVETGGMTGPTAGP